MYFYLFIYLRCRHCTAEIEVVDFGATGIVRCKRCRTYINPYVTWADNGRRWRYAACCDVITLVVGRTCSGAFEWRGYQTVR
jgi:uncharacterized paraquat-inducible protein A